MSQDTTAIDALLNRHGFYTQRIAANEDIPQEQIFVLLGNDTRQRMRQLELFFLPGSQDIRMLQYFCLLPFTVPAARWDVVARFILHLNERISLTGFGLSEERSWVYFRHHQPCETETLSEPVLLHTVGLIAYLVDQGAPLLERLAAGDVDFEQSCEALSQLLIAQAAPTPDSA